jgi:hypothetical protein
MSLSNHTSLSDNQTKSSIHCRNKVRTENTDILNEGRDYQNEGLDTCTKRSLHVKTMHGSDRPDTTSITDDEIPLSNYQHLYTSAFFSNNKQKTTHVVKPINDTLLPSFIKQGNFQRNQPHLAENTPTTLITGDTQREMYLKSNPQHENCDFLSPSEVTTACTGQSPETGFHELSDRHSVNVVKVNPLFMARTNRLRKSRITGPTE